MFTGRTNQYAWAGRLGCWGKNARGGGMGEGSLQVLSVNCRKESDEKLGVGERMNMQRPRNKCNRKAPT